MNTKELANLEIELLIHIIKERYHYDFTHYKRASFKRRIMLCVDDNQYHSISELFPRMIHDESFFQSIIENISVPVSEMFRDPESYLIIRQEVLPKLRTYPYSTIWHAGCANGEEIYSMAIMLFEEGLYERCHLIGTDINKKSISRAKDGIYPYQEIAGFRTNYHIAGGKFDLLDYFHTSIENAIIKNSLKTNVTFEFHNVLSEPLHHEVNMIVCRNVFIYFDRELQDKAVHTFLKCLKSGGILWLGTKESINFSQYANYFDVVSNKHRIYRKRYE